MTERKQNPKSPFAQINRGRMHAFKPRLTERSKRDAVNPADIAALHAMQAARPLTPPPTNFGPMRPSAAAISARQDRPGVARVPRK